MHERKRTLQQSCIDLSCSLKNLKHLYRLIHAQMLSKGFVYWCF